MKAETAGPVIATILERHALANPEYCELELEAESIANRAKPGQFIHIRLADDAGVLLRRPFSIAATCGAKLTILFKRVGTLTSRLAESRPGDRLDILGPLGNGYRIDPGETSDSILVGGGYGVAPLLHLARHLNAMKTAGGIWLLTGARTKAHVVWQERMEAEKWLNTGLATDDGSAGRRGTVVDLVDEILRKRTGKVNVFACGPMPMLAALVRRFPKQPMQVAVESQMGCGIGACQGCVLPMKGRTGVERYARICSDGPVFYGDTIDWDAYLGLPVEAGGVRGA